MRRLSAAIRNGSRREQVGRSFLSACVVVALCGCATELGAQGVWNDPRARALVEQATQRRAEQLADTGLVDYHATAEGYVTFLAQFGDGFLSVPKLIKTDQLALEVYWHAPNQSKQRIIGRRDTLLLPTDIQYHRDHLGIVQNNFPDFIRIGDGDEVRDVPHPLSRAGLNLYDYQLSDSIRITFSGRDVFMIEVKVRPKDDRQPRVVGAMYIDPSEGQVVKMAFNFTHASFIDDQLEDLSIVLENRLVGTKFWLPNRQEIEIRRTGTWLDYPVRGIIRGMWQIGQYDFNLSIPQTVFVGPEIIQAPAAELKQHVWTTPTIMEALPPAVRANVDPDVERIQAEARALVRGQALQRAQEFRLSARHVSDFVQANRVEGLSVGGGMSMKLGSRVSLIGRGRYGIDDHTPKFLGTLRWQRPTGARFELFGSSDLVDVGDQPERSSVINSLASQEFGSDLTDLYLIKSIGVGFGFRKLGVDWGLRAAHERAENATVHARPFSGTFASPLVIDEMKRGGRISLNADRPLGEWGGRGQLEVHSRVSLATGDFTGPGPTASAIGRGSLTVEHRSSMAGGVFVIREAVGASRGFTSGDQPTVFNPAPSVHSRPWPAIQDQVYFGGPQSLPGYAQHSVTGTRGSSTRVEFQFPVPFISVPLGRFGRIPGEAHLAPFVAGAAVGGVTRCSRPVADCAALHTNGFYSSAGIGLLTFFDALRFDIARGFTNRAPWTFNVDFSRDFWSIL